MKSGIGRTEKHEIGFRSIAKDLAVIPISKKMIAAMDLPARCSGRIVVPLCVG
jgi:hypothetical protein